MQFDHTLPMDNMALKLFKNDILYSPFRENLYSSS